MRIKTYLDFFRKNLFKKNPNLTPVGLEKAHELGLITEEEYHRLKILRHEKELKDLQKKSK